MGELKKQAFLINLEGIEGKTKSLCHLAHVRVRVISIKILLGISMLYKTDL